MSLSLSLSQFINLISSVCRNVLDALHCQTPHEWGDAWVKLAHNYCWHANVQDLVTFNGRVARNIAHIENAGNNFPFLQYMGHIAFGLIVLYYFIQNLHEMSLYSESKSALT